MEEALAATSMAAEILSENAGRLGDVKIVGVLDLQQ